MSSLSLSGQAFLHRIKYHHEHNHQLHTNWYLMLTALSTLLLLGTANRGSACSSTLLRSTPAPHAALPVCPASQGLLTTDHQLTAQQEIKNYFTTSPTCFCFDPLRALVLFKPRQTWTQFLSSPAGRRRTQRGFSLLTPSGCATKASSSTTTPHQLLTHCFFASAPQSLLKIQVWDHPCTFRKFNSSEADEKIPEKKCRFNLNCCCPVLPKWIRPNCAYSETQLYFLICFQSQFSSLHNRKLIYLQDQPCKAERERYSGKIKVKLLHTKKYRTWVCRTRVCRIQNKSVQPPSSCKHVTGCT